MLIAAGATFYLLLALFPALAAFVSIYGFVADPVTVADHIAFLGGLLPSGGVELIETQLRSLAAQNEAALSFGFIFGLAVALWSANNGIKTLFEAMNIAYDETEKRSFVDAEPRLAALHARCDRHRHPRSSSSVGVVPAVLAFVGLGSVDGDADFAAALAGALRRRGGRHLRPLPLRPEPRARRNGAGSRGAASSRPRSGCSPRCSSPGTSPISPTTTRPTVRSARSSAS